MARRVVVHEFLTEEDVEQMISDEVSGITAASIGLDQVDNTSDVSKPLSTATQSALDGKADVAHNHDADYASIIHDHDLDYAAIGHDHDTDYADINHNHDTEYASINHNHDGAYVKPSDLSDVATSNDYGDLDNTPTIPAQFNPIAGSNVTITGTYPNMTFASSGGGGGAVDSVNEQTGAVVLDADDIDDASTSHKFTTAADVARLANTSGTNTGDQDLSGYATTSALSSGLAGKSDTSHNHSGVYSPVGHNHDADYADISHNHDSDYAALIHNHSGVYSPVGHDHDTDYAGINHNHDGTYVEPSDLADVATSGDYSDLAGTPAIPDALADLDTTVTGAQLNSLKSKVDGIAAGAEVNVQSDWDAVSGDAQILNKPSLLTVAGDGVAATASRSDHQHEGNGDYSTALGHNASADEGSVALGESASADEYSAAVGYYASATGGNSSALGTDANAAGNGAVAIGWFAKATQGRSIVIGMAAEAAVSLSPEVDRSAIAIGDSALAGHQGAIALGAFASPPSANTMQVSAHTLILDAYNISSESLSNEPSTIRLRNASGDQVDISVDASNNIVVTPV